MFETDDFKNKLADTIRQEAEDRKMEQYEIEQIVDFLQRLAAANERELMEREFRKPASDQRGMPDALMSARTLTREASKYAAAENRTLLKLADFQAAYKAKFCHVWPFCKS